MHKVNKLTPGYWTKTGKMEIIVESLDEKPKRYATYGDWEAENAKLRLKQEKTVKKVVSGTKTPEKAPKAKDKHSQPEESVSPTNPNRAFKTKKAAGARSSFRERFLRAQKKVEVSEDGDTIVVKWDEIKNLTYDEYMALHEDDSPDPAGTDIPDDDSDLYIDEWDEEV